MSEHDLPERFNDRGVTSSGHDGSHGRELDRLAAIVHRLRAPNGCPWDREQTLASLRRFVLEEAYEVVDAIDRNDAAALKDELGDFVFEAVLLAEICSEQGRFTIGDALAAVTDKLVRRHPHVFGTSDGTPAPVVSTAGEVKGLWERIKATERTAAGEPQALLSGIPQTLPALLRAYKIGLRTATVGFDWADIPGVAAKVDEELAELHEALDHGHTAAVEEELGDLLFSIANLARKTGVDPEAALRQANEKFARRFAELERRFTTKGRPLGEASLDEMEAEWAQIKRDE